MKQSDSEVMTKSRRSLDARGRTGFVQLHEATGVEHRIGLLHVATKNKIGLLS